MLKMFKSKTIWVNGLTFVAGLVAYLAGTDLIAAHPEAVACLVAIGGVVNVALRLVTTLPVWEK